MGRHGDGATRRWTIISLRAGVIFGTPAALVCLLAAINSVPIVLRLFEALLWFAVWLVRHPLTRYCVKKLWR